jgi:hypothetical protein
MNRTQLPKAYRNPSGWPAKRTSVIAATPIVVRARARTLRLLRAADAASSTVPRNSTAPTVDSGSRASAR